MRPIPIPGIITHNIPGIGIGIDTIPIPELIQIPIPIPALDSYRYRYWNPYRYRYQTDTDTDTGIGIGTIPIPIPGIGGTLAPDMEKGADVQTLSAEIFENCGRLFSLIAEENHINCENFF